MTTKELFALIRKQRSDYKSYYFFKKNRFAKPVIHRSFDIIIVDYESRIKF